MSANALRTAITGQAVTTTQKPTDIFGYLKTYQSEIARALPRHMTPDRMARIVTTEIRKIPKLLQCDVKSLFGAVIQCSQLGLEPGSGLGHAYLIPYGTECQLIIGYRGMIDLARRSGQMISLMGEAVYAKDKFEYELGLEPKLKHVPSIDSDRGELVYVYAVAVLVGGGRQFVVMSKGDVERIRRRSKAKDNGPWQTDYDAMAIKTAIRRLFKYLPVSVELQRAVIVDETADRGEQHNADILDGAYTTTTDDEPTGELVDSDTGEVTPIVTFANVMEQIQTAETTDALDVAADLLRSVQDEGQRAELDVAARKRRKELESAK